VAEKQNIHVLILCLEEGYVYKNMDTRDKNDLAVIIVLTAAVIIMALIATILNQTI
jgi:hypothetical protein